MLRFTEGISLWVSYFNLMLFLFLIDRFEQDMLANHPSRDPPSEEPIQPDDSMDIDSFSDPDSPSPGTGSSDAVHISDCGQDSDINGISDFDSAQSSTQGTSCMYCMCL
jgi:hypothetical protein